MTHLVVSDQQKVKAEIARELEEAVRDADAYNGPGDRNYFRGHAHFDLVAGVSVLSPDCPVTGILTHDTPHCPYCYLKRVRRLCAVMEGKRHVH
jgi:hypothetical protein